MDMQPKSDGKVCRCWFRFAFSLRTFMLMVAISAGIAGWIAYERQISRQEMQIARNLRGQGAIVETCGPFDDEWGRNSFVEIRDPLPRLQYNVRAWCSDVSKQVLGTRIVCVAVLSSKPTVEQLATLSKLQLLWLDGSSFDDQDVASLQQALPNCRIIR